MVSANHWLRGIKTYRLSWYLTRVSANHASSDWALNDFFGMGQLITIKTNNDLEKKIKIQCNFTVRDKRNIGFDLSNRVLDFFLYKIYQRINIRVVLKALEIWTNGDPYEREKKGGPDLGKFNTYRVEFLKKKFPHDNAQLLR